MSDRLSSGPRPTANLPATLNDAQAAIMIKHVRERIRAVRGGGDDPFDSETMHAAQREMLKIIAAENEVNCSFVLKMAIVEMEDAHEALVALFNERFARDEPIGSALRAYYNLNQIAPPPRPTARRPSTQLSRGPLYCASNHGSHGLVPRRESFPQSGQQATERLLDRRRGSH
jgi:hypothetical protein